MRNQSHPSSISTLLQALLWLTLFISLSPLHNRLNTHPLLTLAYLTLVELLRPTVGSVRHQRRVGSRLKRLLIVVLIWRWRARRLLLPDLEPGIERTLVSRRGHPREQLLEFFRHSLYRITPTSFGTDSMRNASKPAKNISRPISLTPAFVFVVTKIISPMTATRRLKYTITILPPF